MEWLWIILGAVLIGAGIIGCLLPILPGPPLSYLGILCLQLLEKPRFESGFLLIWAGIVLVVVVLDYIIPVYGTKRMGGSRRGVIGSLIGLLVGIFIFPPFGIIIGPALGALIGESIGGKEGKNPMKAAIGSFLGFMTGVFLKLLVSGFLTMYYITNLKIHNC